MEALQKQREQQQGLGKPIFSTLFHGYRFVAVGGQLFYSKSWKTFHDFLDHFIKTILGGTWENDGLKKPDQFFGAYYEAYAAGALIRCWF